MNHPGADKLVVERNKVVDYLLPRTFHTLGFGAPICNRLSPSLRALSRLQVGAPDCPLFRARHEISGLNAAHSDNGGKAQFVLGLGFSRHDWQHLAAAFRKAAANGLVAKTVASSHGTKYIVESRIKAPCGKKPLVRTV
jgi:hypothetical protein